jgi:hypothetical protein
MVYSKGRPTQFMKWFFILVILELFLGGGGRLLDLGALTFRMIFFFTGLYIVLLYLIIHLKMSSGLRLAFGLVVIYVVAYIPPFVIGSMNGNDLRSMTLDVRQSLYWLSAPFFALVLNSQEIVLRTAALVRASGCFLAACYVAVVIALSLGIIDYLPFYIALNETGEFAFRGGSFFFYKGFLFIGVAMVFFLSSSRKFSVLLFILMSIALTTTMTRGFVLSTFFALFLMLSLQRRWKILFIAILVFLCSVSFIWLYMPAQDAFIEVSRDISNEQRIGDLAYILNKMNVWIFLFGDGLGSLINGRINIENTFLWAIWKLGIGGVLFWLAPLFICLNYFAHIKKCNSNYGTACAYMFSTILIYVQTMSNPYLNNPIGLSFILIAIFSLRTLSSIDSPSPDVIQYPQERGAQ